MRQLLTFNLATLASYIPPKYKAVHSTTTEKLAALFENQLGVSDHSFSLGEVSSVRSPVWSFIVFSFFFHM